MMAWLTSIVAFFSSGWIVLEGSVVIKQGGEQHDVNLSLDLWRVTYAASRRVRGNVVGEVDSTSSVCGQKQELAPGTEVVQGTCRLVTFARVASALSWAVPAPRSVRVALDSTARARTFAPSRPHVSIARARGAADPVDRRCRGVPTDDFRQSDVRDK